MCRTFVTCIPSPVVGSSVPTQQSSVRSCVSATGLRESLAKLASAGRDRSSNGVPVFFDVLLQKTISNYHGVWFGVWGLGFGVGGLESYNFLRKGIMIKGLPQDCSCPLIR